MPESMYFLNFDSKSEKLPKFDILFFTLFIRMLPMRHCLMTAGIHKVRKFAILAIPRFLF